MLVLFIIATLNIVLVIFFFYLFDSMQLQLVSVFSLLIGNLILFKKIHAKPDPNDMWWQLQQNQRIRSWDLNSRPLKSRFWHQVEVTLFQPVQRA